MSKSVLVSIKPKWCELIASGLKTIEVRKTKPKIETPFKCYIYETKAPRKSEYYNEFHKKTVGKVVGEFICDNIDNHSLSELIVKEDRELALLSTCLTRDEILDYLGYERGTNIYGCKNYDFYGWHISNLKIYDEPKELSEFEIRKDCGGYFKWHKLSRPPQSWCYVEKLKEREEM